MTPADQRAGSEITTGLLESGGLILQAGCGSKATVQSTDGARLSPAAALSIAKRCSSSTRREWLQFRPLRLGQPRSVAAEIDLGNTLSGCARKRELAHTLFGTAVFLLAVGILFCAGMERAEIVAGCSLCLMLLGTASGGGLSGRIEAGFLRDSSGKIKAYTMRLGPEVTTLYPGVSWSLVDRHKWTARGLIEEPNQFHVHSDGTVEINREKIKLSDPEGQEKLQQQINKRHGTLVSHERRQETGATEWQAATQSGDEKPRFNVKLDRFGHIFIECIHGSEREETGLRGIATLIHKGMMVKPRDMRVDPLQRAVEIDGVRYECDAAGAKRLEQALNTRYIPNSGGDKQNVIHIRESLSSSTGYDIQFQTVRAGMPFEVKGHLTQETLDELSDTNRCALLETGIQLRIAAPFLLVRRRRPDLGEEKIPGIPDVNYLRTNAAQLEQILNHPHIRRGGGGVREMKMRGAEESPLNLAQIRVVRSPANEQLCWFQCVMSDGSVQSPRAITHHNIAELQQAGVFRPDLDVLLSLDNSVLSVLDKTSRQGQSVTLNSASTADELLIAGRMLTNALKPVAPRAKAASPAATRDQKSGPIKVSIPAKPVTGPAVAEASPLPDPPPETKFEPESSAKPDLETAIKRLINETDPVRINLDVFARLATRFGLPVQDARFSLPMVFDERRFEIINFEEGEITSVMELRDEWFYGFYLSHNSEKKVVLVYACNGTHIEWGPDKCVVQQSIRSEPEEFNTFALLGFAQDKQDQFVFIVTPGFREWIKTRKKHCADVTVFFCTIKEIAAAPDDYQWVWPERPSVS